MRPADVAKLIEQTELCPDSPYGRYTELCREALQYDFHAVCVNSFYVPLVSKWLVNQPEHKVKVCSVVGFPSGASSILSKVVEASDAIANGADEIDIVVNIGALKTGDYKRVRDELQSLRDIVKDKVLKVILEVGYLSQEQTKIGCELCIDTKCDFVKTSTGMNFKQSGADTIRYAQILKDCVKGTSVKVKASASIRTAADVKSLIKIGVDRIGTSKGVQIMKELQGDVK